MKRFKVSLLFISILIAFAIILTGCGAGGSTSSTTPSTALSEKGIPETIEVPFSKETINEVKKRESIGSEVIREPRVIPFQKQPPPKELKEEPLPEPKKPDTGAEPQSRLIYKYPQPKVPALSNNFSGLGDAGTVIPPDTMGAVGPSHLMEILNDRVGFFNKSTGQLISSVTLQSFWSSLGTGTGQPANYPFDPKVIYDQYNGRFIAVTLGGAASSSSWIMLGVSATSDPTGTWYKWAIDADVEGSTQTGNYADFPGLGIDADNVYITVNMFNSSDSYQYSTLRVIPKTQLLSGTSAISLNRFSNPTGSGFTLQPAHTFGASSVEYIVHGGYSISGTPPRRFLRLAKITFSGGTPSWIDMGYIEVTSYPTAGFPNAPQLGSSNTIETNDSRLLNAVFRNGYLWATHTVTNDANTKTEIAWYQIDPSLASLSSPYGTPVQQVRISDSSRWYYYPSIAVNSNDDAGIGFSGSSNSEYVSAYYTARFSSDTLGTVQSVGVLKSGLAPYYKTYSGTENRWGDYSATCIDPADDLTFWTLQEYASTPSGGNDMWGTWWGILDAPPTPPSGLSGSVSSASEIALGWTDNSSTETGFKIERKTGAGGTYSEIATVGANVTTYNNTGLSEATTYYYRVRAYNTSGNSSYSSEVSALTFPAPPSGLSASASSTSQINLSWTDNSGGETGFRIERKTGTGGTYSEIATPSANTTTYSDTGLSASTTYYYRVRAYNASGNSTYSSETSATTPSSEGGGGGGGCFIATAAYGSYLDPHVKVLREFRDKHLLTNPFGRVFVSFYYRTSPPIADYIREHETMRTATRWLLTPIVYGIKYPGSVILITMGFGAAFGVSRRVRKDMGRRDNIVAR